MSFHSDDVLKQSDYDLHGLVGIRLIDAKLSDVNVVNYHLGPIRKNLNRDPDIIIRFVDRLPTSSKMLYIGVDDAGFTEDTFLLLRSQRKSPAKVSLPFGDIGEKCEIVCERGLKAIPLLKPIINLTILSKNVLPMHASAFNFNGTGVLVTGWSKGGKTETLLAFVANGAEYIGDEWVYLTADGQRMYGIPEPIRIWDWQLESMPQFRKVLNRGDRTRLLWLRLLVRSLEMIISIGVLNQAAPGKMIRRTLPILKRQLYVQIPPEILFGSKVGSLVNTPDKIFFLASRASNEVTVQRIDAQEIARRMIFSLQQEQMEFMSSYMKFRFAFPEELNNLIEQSEIIQRRLLLQALAGKDAFAVYHPYPVSIPSLYEAISPFCK